MAVSWGFATLLALTLVALVTFSQPVFQSEAVVGHKQSDLKIARTEGVIQALGATSPPPNLLASKISPPSSSSSRQRWTRKLNRQRRSVSPPEGQVKEVNATKPQPSSRRSVLATFQSDRMVPTGPNPLHNSNRSQVIFP